jgi:hypothetical protein
MEKLSSGLAKIGIAFLPWLPGALICRFWIQYFGAQSELIDKLGNPDGNGAVSIPPVQVTHSSSQHPFEIVLTIAGLAFAVGVVLVAMAFLRRRRRMHFNQSI